MERDRPVNAAGTRSHEGELEERRLALEFEPLKVERQKAGIELRLKRDPSGATNHGIALSELSRYLGKTAS